MQSRLKAEARQKDALGRFQRSVMRVLSGMACGDRREQGSLGRSVGTNSVYRLSVLGFCIFSLSSEFLCISHVVAISCVLSSRGPV
ncbi:hypothetical protein E2C01_085503 [Portunus trituberculatus]|uniref:Uncharacterized protein n=1 Tax=Portunus trituberculatus TaxID=210409 RepID=A0A5B7J7S9_PORTR|nr:hypothetical protein [Portunus trituberculatus]